MIVRDGSFLTKSSRNIFRELLFYFIGKTAFGALLN